MSARVTASAGTTPLWGNLDRPQSLRRLAGLAQRVLHLAPPATVGATDERTGEVLQKAEEYFAKQPEIEHYFTVAGFSFAGRAQNSALAFIRLKPWEERDGKEHKVQAVIQRALMGLSGIKDAMVFSVNPPAIPELGTSSGFDFWLQDVGGVGHEALIAASNTEFELTGQRSALPSSLDNPLRHTYHAVGNYHLNGVH